MVNGWSWPPTAGCACWNRSLGWGWSEWRKLTQFCRPLTSAIGFLTSRGLLNLTAPSPAGEHELAREAPLNAHITALILISSIPLRQVKVSNGPLQFLSLSCGCFAVFRQRTGLPSASSSQCSMCSAVICVAQWVVSTATCWMVQNVLSSSGSSVVRLKSPQLATPTSVGS
jgi:hypothetical protein